MNEGQDGFMDSPTPRLMFDFAVDGHAAHPVSGDVAYAGSRLLALASGGASMSSPGLASVIAIEALASLDALADTGDPMVALHEGIQRAVGSLRTRAASDAAWHTTATSLTALLYGAGQVAVAHIGRSRAYVVRSGRLIQITRDHTLEQLLIDRGMQDNPEWAARSERSSLTRWLDGRREEELDYQTLDVELGDRFIIITGGSHNVASIDRICDQMKYASSVHELMDMVTGLLKQMNGRFACIAAEVVLYSADRVCEPRIIGSYGDNNPFS